MLTIKEILPQPTPLRQGDKIKKSRRRGLVRLGKVIEDVMAELQEARNRRNEEGKDGLHQ